MINKKDLKTISSITNKKICSESKPISPDFKKSYFKLKNNSSTHLDSGDQFSFEKDSKKLTEKLDNLSNILNTINSEKLISSFYQWIEFFIFVRFFSWGFDIFFNEDLVSKETITLDVQNKKRINSFSLGIIFQEYSLLNFNKNLTVFDLAHLVENFNEISIFEKNLVDQYMNTGVSSALSKPAATATRTTQRQAATAKFRAFNPHNVQYNRLLRVMEEEKSKNINEAMHNMGLYGRVAKMVPDRLFYYYHGCSFERYVSVLTRLADEKEFLNRDAEKGPRHSTGKYRFHNHTFASNIHRNWGNLYVEDLSNSIERVAIFDMYRKNTDLIGFGVEELETSDIHELILTGKIRRKTIPQLFHVYGNHLENDNLLLLPENAVYLPTNIQQLPYHDSNNEVLGLSPALSDEIIHYSQVDPTVFDDFTQRQVIKIFIPTKPGYTKNLDYVLSPNTDDVINTYLEFYAESFQDTYGVDFEVAVQGRFL